MSTCSNEIDRAARDQLAERLRHLIAGTISNFHFERSASTTNDLAIFEIEERLAWPCYDDFQEHKLTGEHALTDGARRDFARAILFLKTDLPYLWRPKKGLRAFLNSFFFFTRRPLDVNVGELRYWPFFSQQDYKTAKMTPPYLSSVDT